MKLGWGGSRAQGVEGCGIPPLQRTQRWGTRHNLTDLVVKFGSQEAAFKAIQQATEAAVQQQGLTGVFQTTVRVAGETVTVRGNVIGGVVKIGTAFK